MGDGRPALRRCGGRRPALASGNGFLVPCPRKPYRSVAGKPMNVLTIGGAMLDTIVTIASDRIEQMKMRNAESSFLLLEEGLKTEVDQIATHVGGGAVNA